MAPPNQVTKQFTLARVNLVVGAHAIVQRMKGNTPLVFYRDPKDRFDPENAVMVVVPTPQGNRKVGYLPPGLAKEIAPLLAAGVRVIGRKAEKPLYGVCDLAYIPPTPPPATTEAQKEVPDGQPATEAPNGNPSEGV